MAQKSPRNRSGIWVILKAPYDVGAAFHTAQIRAELESVGTPIGAYDQMIAGHARSCGLVVVSNNTREFQRVSGLRMENWVQ